MARERRSPSVARQGYSYSPSDLSRYLDGLPDDRLPNLYLRLELDGWRALSSRQSSATAGDCSLWLWSDAYGALRDFYAEWTWRLLAEDGSVLHTSHTPMRGFCPPSFVDPLYPPENGHKCRDFNTSVLRNAKQPDGTLSIQIELTVKVPQLVQDQIRLGEEADALKLKLRRRNKALRQANVFRSTLASMRNDKTFSDFTIVVGKRDFAVNRCVLATRSPVFAAMFEKEMQEKANNHVTLDDTTPEAFESFLGALYGCEYHFLAKMEATQDVLSLANKYCVADIKTTCDVRLAAFVNESNAMKVLMETAALCNAEATKAKCIELLCGHVTWLESSDWLDFKADHSRLAAGIISDLTKLQAAKAAKRKRMLTKEAARGRARFRSCRKNAIRQFREEVKEKQDWDDATGLPRLPSFINALCIDAIAGGVQDD